MLILKSGLSEFKNSSNYRKEMVPRLLCFDGKDVGVAVTNAADLLLGAIAAHVFRQ